MACVEPFSSAAPTREPTPNLMAPVAAKAEYQTLK